MLLWMWKQVVTVYSPTYMFDLPSDFKQKKNSANILKVERVSVKDLDFGILF